MAQPREHKEDAMWLEWQKAAPKIYDRIYYNPGGLISYCNRWGHRQLEKPFSAGRSFERVLEVGAGTGMHLDFVRHSYQEYHMSDLNQGMLDKAKERHGGNSRVVFEVQDACALDYPDQSFDRVISVYNLEHLPRPHEVIKEWGRVLRPGGVTSVAIPTEGGLAWNLGRHLTTRRQFRKLGLDLDYIVSREHINCAYRLVALIRYYYPKAKFSWFPSLIPLSHVNLLITCHLMKDRHCRLAV